MLYEVITSLCQLFHQLLDGDQLLDTIPVGSGEEKAKFGIAEVCIAETVRDTETHLFCFYSAVAGSNTVGNTFDIP